MGTTRRGTCYNCGKPAPRQRMPTDVDMVNRVSFVPLTVRKASVKDCDDIFPRTKPELAPPKPIMTYSPFMF